MSYRQKIPWVFLIALILSTGINLSGQEGAELTQEEARWLREEHTVRIRIGDWPPFMIYEEGDISGISIDFIEDIFHYYDIDFEYISPEVYTWSEALESLASREDIDLLPTAKITEERSRQMLFSREYISPPWVIFTRKDSPAVQGIQDLSGKTLSVQYGYYMHDLLKKDYPDIHLRVYDGPTSTLDSLKALAVGEVDGFVGNLATGSYLINQEHLYDLKVAAPTPFGTHSNAMAVRSDWPELVSIINKGLERMTKEEKNAIFGQYYSVEYDYGIGPQTVLKWLLIAFPGLFIIAYTVIHSYRKMNREIHSRGVLHGELSDYIDLVDHNVLSLKCRPDWIITKVSEAFCTLSGYSEKEILGRRLKDFLNPDTSEEWLEECRQKLKQGESLEGELQTRKKEGPCFWVKYSMFPDHPREGEDQGYTLLGQDISDKKIIEALSIRDKLTGLFNRLKLDDVFSYEIRLSRRHERALSIILSDLDGFKQINDSYGHSTGDRYLYQYGQILNSCIRCSDTLGRWGGDEFLIICPDLPEEQTPGVLRKLQNALEKNHFEGIGPISASFGAASFREGDDEVEMLNRADKELYRNKSRRSAGPEKEQEG